MSHKEVKEIIAKCFCKRYCTAAVRVRFTLRKRFSGESIAGYINSLLAFGRCEFGQTPKERLRDQVIFNINDQDIQK